MNVVLDVLITGVTPIRNIIFLAIILRNPRLKPIAGVSISWFPDRKLDPKSIALPNSKELVVPILISRSYSKKKVNSSTSKSLMKELSESGKVGLAPNRKEFNSKVVVATIEIGKPKVKKSTPT